MKLCNIYSIQKDFVQGILISKKLVITNTLYIGDVNGKVHRCKRKSYMTVAKFKLNDKEIKKVFIYGFIYEYHNLKLDNEYVFCFSRKNYVNVVFAKDTILHSVPELSGAENTQIHVKKDNND